MQSGEYDITLPSLRHRMVCAYIKMICGGSAEIHVTVVYMAWKMAKDSQVQVAVTYVVLGRL